MTRTSRAGLVNFSKSQLQPILIRWQIYGESAPTSKLSVAFLYSYFCTCQKISVPCPTITTAKVLTVVSSYISLVPATLTSNTTILDSTIAQSAISF